MRTLRTALVPAFAAIAVASFAQPQTLALYRNKYTGHPTVDVVGPNGAVLSKVVLNRLFPDGAEGFAVGLAPDFRGNPPAPAGSIAVAYKLGQLIWVEEYDPQGKRYIVVNN